MSDSDETAAAAAALAGRLQHGVAGPLDTIAVRLDALMVMTPDATVQRELGDAAARLKAVTGEVRTAIAELRLGDGDPTSLTGRVRGLALAAGQRLGCTPKITLDGPLDELDAVEANAIVSLVANYADDLDDKLISEFGGRLYARI